MSKELESHEELKASKDSIELNLNECYFDEELPYNEKDVTKWCKDNSVGAESTIELSGNKCYNADHLHWRGDVNEELVNQDGHLPSSHTIEECLTNSSDFNNHIVAHTPQSKASTDNKNCVQVSPVSDDKKNSDKQKRYQKTKKSVNQFCQPTKIMLATVAIVAISMAAAMIVIIVAHVEIAKIKADFQAAMSEENHTQSELLHIIENMAQVIAYQNETCLIQRNQNESYSIMRNWNETYLILQNQNESECKDLTSNLNLTQLETRVSNFAKLFSFPTTSYGRQAHILIFNSCSDVLSLHLPSGRYLVRTSSGPAVSMYCDMSLTCGGVKGGWARVAHMDFTRPTTSCPLGLLRENFIVPSCARYFSSPGCSLITLPIQGVAYSRVCAKVIGIQNGHPNGFSRHDRERTSGDLSSTYLDGVSITHGHFAHHIWSFAAIKIGKRECSCSVDKPSYVGPHYSCDADYGVGNHSLWDGIGCPAHNKEWFYRNLAYSTSDDIEVRLCRDEERQIEDVLLQSLQLYIQ